MTEEWLGPSVFGRERELEWLRDKARGPGKAIVVFGAPGVGKTALLERYFYSIQRRSWVLWRLHPDPASFEALRANIEGLYERDDNTEIVAIDNAESLSDKSAADISNRILNLKRIRAVIFSSRKRLSIPRGSALELRNLVYDEDAPPDGGLYELHGGILLPEREILTDVQPRLVLANQSLVERLQRTPHLVHDLSPRQFEELIADLLHDQGCEVHITPTTRDGGKDILAYIPTPLGKILCLVEAKRYREDRPVGVGLVRQLYGTLVDAGANSAMLVTTSYFSKDARAFRQKHEYRLDFRDYTNVVQWIRNYGQR